VSVAVVTGGGRGLGRGIVEALAGSGFDCVIGYAFGATDAEGAARAVTATGRRAVTVCGDVRDADTAKLLLDAAIDLGGPDAWVNNAGVSVLAPLIETDPADLVRMFDVNVLGVLHGMQAAARWFAANRRPGRIVNLASDLGLQAFPMLGGYAATKFAVVGLTQTAAIELAADQITVNAVCPGTAETDMVLAERSSEMTWSGRTADQVRQSYLQAIPAGRFCTPADVGALVAWLCGPTASYVTGQSVCVNGGSVLH
jgi:meso-butanediol dehydrogenase / (S,S)-butanediol dehydrogenase / diacetyl reductase